MCLFAAVTCAAATRLVRCGAGGARRVEKEGASEGRRSHLLASDGFGHPAPRVGSFGGGVAPAGGDGAEYFAQIHFCLLEEGKAQIPALRAKKRHQSLKKLDRVVAQLVALASLQHLRDCATPVRSPPGGGCPRPAPPAPCASALLQGELSIWRVAVTMCAPLGRRDANCAPSAASAFAASGENHPLRPPLAVWSGWARRSRRQQRAWRPRGEASSSLHDSH